MIQKLINYLFAVAIALVLVLMLLVVVFALPAQANTATGKLAATTVRVEGPCTGSASVVVGKSGHHYILTNSHVCMCAGFKHSLFTTYEGGTMLKGKVVKQSWAFDLCAARVEDTVPALKLARRLYPDESVTTRGYPEGRLAVSHGNVLGPIEWDYVFPIAEIGECPKGIPAVRDYNDLIVGCQMHWTSILSNLYSRPGSSGSPVVDDNGDLVGVLSSWHPGDDYDAGQVPYRDLKAFLGSL